MRRGLLAFAALLVCGAIRVEAQPAPPPQSAASPHSAVPPPVKRHLGALLGQHGRGGPVPADRQPTPEFLFDATNLGSPVVLDKGWRVGITANQDAANPDFDDSSWALRQAKETIAEVPDEDRPPETKGDRPGRSDEEALPDLPQGHKRPFAWFRLHIKLAPGHGPVAVLVELPVSHNTSIDLGTGGTGQDIDVYGNGKLIQPDGPHGDTASHYLPVSRIFNLDVPPSQT